MSGIYDFSVSLNTTGGSFSISTVDPGPALGATCTVLGMGAFVTSSGQTKNNSKNAYTTEGQFGTVLLHKPLALLWGSNAIFQPLLPNQNLQIPGSSNWQTVQGAALAIAGQCGITLTWQIHDNVYDSAVQEVGMSAIDALQNLAARVGGVLRWAGNNNYFVTWPDVPSPGTWTVPSARLLTSAGIEYQNLLDLTLFGNYGTRFLASTNFPATSGAEKQVPSDTNPTNNGNTPPTGATTGLNDITVTQIGKVAKLLTTDDPPVVFDLPQDYYQVFIQILVARGKDTQGEFVTDDPAQWFSYDPQLAGAPIGANYIYSSYLGGRSLPQVAVDSYILPSANTAVQNGNFVVNMACSRLNFTQNRGAASTAAAGKNKQEQAEAAAQAQVQAMLTQYEYSAKFVQTYSGKINCINFGTIPLPGMTASATLDGITVTGIVQNVSVTPSSISIDVAQFKRLDFIQERQTMSTSNATGPS